MSAIWGTSIIGDDFKKEKGMEQKNRNHSGMKEIEANMEQNKAGQREGQRKEN